MIKSGQGTFLSYFYLMHTYYEITWKKETVSAFNELEISATRASTVPITITTATTSIGSEQGALMESLFLFLTPVPDLMIRR